MSEYPMGLRNSNRVNIRGPGGGAGSDGIGCYGNTGFGVFKQGGTKLERFLPNNQHTPKGGNDPHKRQSQL